MVVYSSIILLGLIKLILPKNKSCNIFLIFLASMLLFLISSFRSISFGTDTIGYVNSYILLGYRNLSDLWLNFITNTGKDPFFYLVSKIVNLTGASYQIWLAAIAGIFSYSIAKLIDKYSEEPYLSFVSLISLGYFYFSLTGLRQTMALSFIVLSYNYLRERKLIAFVTLVIMGSLFHSTAIIFLIAYPISNIKVGWKQTLGILMLFIGVYFFKNQVREIISYFNIIEVYQSYNEREVALSFSGFIIQLFIYLFCLWFKDDILKDDIKNQSLYNLLFLGLVFQLLAVIIAEFFRISMYFSIFGIILIPNALNKIKDKNLKIIVYLLVFSAFMLYLFRNGTFNGYKFYWQG